MANVPPKIQELVAKVLAEGTSKRAVAALNVMLRKGSVSTDELNELGYNHPPRVIGDIRDAGIPVETTRQTSNKTGRRMAVYVFGDPSRIQDGRVGGRSALPKAFKEKLITKYGMMDCITGARLDSAVLQIDHRVPYRIAGDVGLHSHDVEAYMLLDASSQRAKSWSCENCPNMLGTRDPKVCGNCYWAFPEAYQHIATKQIRRTDIAWQGLDVLLHDKLKAMAVSEGKTLAGLIIELARQKAKTA
jgi:hypothetical protein